MDNVTLHLGDCLPILKTFPDDSVDSFIADPPAGISFMGKEWDSNKGGRDQWIAWLTEVMLECLRVMKPGAHGLVWALPRTSHWTAMALENAGFEIRDRVAHIFGNGFPKSLDVSKAMDKSNGVERNIAEHKRENRAQWRFEGHNTPSLPPATDEAKQWDGWGTALKPAMEDWWLIRKPLSEKTVAANVLKWGTGALNIDACRVELQDAVDEKHRQSAWSDHQKSVTFHGGKYRDMSEIKAPKGRFPSHVIHDGSDEVLAHFPQSEVSGSAKNGKPATRGDYSKDGDLFGGIGNRQGTLHNDFGSAARFFYCAKASAADRDEGLEEFERRETSLKYNGGDGFSGRTQINGEWVNTSKDNRIKPRNHHPTVKSTELMRYLCRLITPPNGVILDCFMGSGSTGKGAVIEGFNFIGIEQEPEYFEIAKRRIKAAELPLFAFTESLEANV